MATKEHGTDQHSGLHGTYGKENCCLCRAEAERDALKAEVERKAIEIGELKAEVKKLRDKETARNWKPGDGIDLNCMTAQMRKERGIPDSRPGEMVKPRCAKCRDTGQVVEDSGGQNPDGSWINILRPCPECKIGKLQAEIERLYGDYNTLATEWADCKVKRDALKAEVERKAVEIHGLRQQLAQLMAEKTAQNWRPSEHDEGGRTETAKEKADDECVHRGR